MRTFSRTLGALALAACILAASSAPGAFAGELTVMAVGDILPHPSWQPFQIPTSKLMEGVVETFFGADVVIGNLESPLTGQAMPTATKTAASVEAKREFVFRADAEDTAEGLKGAGFTVLTLANNHMLDYREAGLLDTLERLGKAGIAVAGAGRDAKEAYAPAVVRAKDTELVVLSASDVVPKGYWALADKPGIASLKDEAAFLERIKAARAQHPDAVLALSVHWGVEATLVPTARQKKLARKFIDAGADVVLGHHPHRLQGVELYKGRPIFYSLGNFQFDTNPPGDETVIARLVYKDGARTPAEVGVMPVIIEPGGYPKVLGADDPRCTKILTDLGKLCGPLGVALDGGRITPAPEQQAPGYDYWGT